MPKTPRRIRGSLQDEELWGSGGKGGGASLDCEGTRVKEGVLQRSGKRGAGWRWV